MYVCVDNIVSGVELNLGNMMKAKETSVSQLTTGVATLFKMNKVLALPPLNPSLTHSLSPSLPPSLSLPSGHTYVRSW